MGAEEERSVDESLRRERALLKALVENVPEGVAIVAPDGRLAYWNQHFLDIWKVPPALLENAKDGEGVKWAAEQTDNPEWFLRQMEQVYLQPMKTIVEDTVILKSGRTLSRFGKPVEEGGKHIGWLWTFRDVTEQLETERQLRQLSRGLEQRVEERTRELEEQTARLRHLASELASTEHRERKRLAAVLHDDLQQLLAAANMGLMSLERRLTEERDRKDIARVAAWVSQAGTAARDLAHELRPPALYEDGLIPALRWLAGRMRERHQLGIAIRAGQGLPVLTDDINALLFDSTRELLFNVVKYADVDRASVAISADEQRITLIVEDEGKGFSGKRGRGGRDGGFGLFSIRERLKGLGGEVSVVSREGRGTRILLSVPLNVAVKREDAERVPPVVANGSSGEKAFASGGGDIRVLVVDDHALVRQGIANVLRREKRIRVVGEAGDGVAAIEAVEEMCPEVVLMDINMPRMNGIEATREIHRRWPEKIIIGLSVQDDEATRASMFVSGAQEFLSKSGNADLMVSTILRLNNRG